MKTIDQLTDAEITRIAAEDVMGWNRFGPAIGGEQRFDIPCQGVVSFSPLTDANDDVMVLEKVKQNLQLMMALDRYLDMRWIRHTDYETGEYTRSAVAVLLARKEKDRVQAKMDELGIGPEDLMQNDITYP